MTRRTLDQYYTPEIAVNDLKLHLEDKLRIDGIIFDPCYGDGAFFPLYRNGFLITNDLDPRTITDYRFDMTYPENWENVTAGTKLDWVVSNPPFNKGLEIIENAIDHSRNVLMLLRLSFLEPTIKRSKLLTENPPNAIIVTPRISFTENKKVDSVTTAWFYWGPANLPPISVIPHPKHG